MAENLTSLLGDLQLLVKELEEQRKKKEPETGPTDTPDPDAAPASGSSPPNEKPTGEVNDLTIKTDGKAGVVIGVSVDESSAVKLERFEVTPEPDGRVRIMVSAKKEEL
jgi:hypothetical protein